MEYNIDNKNDVIDLKNAMQYQNDSDVIVIDTEAQSKEDLKKSYVGKYIAQCDICDQLLYTDDRDLSTIEACPYCGFNDCFYLIGVVTAIPTEQFVQEYKEDQEDKDLSKTDLVYGEAVKDS